MMQNWKKQERGQGSHLISYAVLHTNIAASQLCEPDTLCLCKSKLTAEVNIVFLSIKKHTVHHV